MKKRKRGGKQRASLASVAAKAPSRTARPALIHPIVIFPFRPAEDYGNLTLDPQAQGITRNEQGQRVSLMPVS